ncbi:unnamed protein product [Symbiodinium sp. CCMP2592]|nr:unnamed protein product [Symbiodinium sp. CCMP2592]
MSPHVKPGFWGKILALLVLLGYGGSLAVQPVVFSQPKPQPRKGLPNDLRTSAMSQDPGDFVLTASERALLRELGQAAKRRQWRKVKELQGAVRIPKTPFFNAELDAALKCREYQAGAEVYDELCALSLPQAIVSYNLGMKLFAKLGDGARVRSIWAEARKAYKMDVTMAAARLVAAADEADMETALSLLDEMKDQKVQADAGHFTSVVRACQHAPGGGHQEVMRAYRLMVDMDVTPHLRFYTILSTAFAGKPVEDLQEILADMERRGLEYDTVFADKHLQALLSERKVRVDKIGEIPRNRLMAAAAALAKFKTARKASSKFCKKLEEALQGEGFGV